MRCRFLANLRGTGGSPSEHERFSSISISAPPIGEDESTSVRILEPEAESIGSSITVYSTAVDVLKRLAELLPGFISTEEMDRDDISI